MGKIKNISEYSLAYFWLLPALINFCSGVTSKMLGSSVGALATLMLYGLLVFVLINGYNKGILRVTKFDIFGALFVSISIVGTYALFPQNEIYLDYSLANWPFSLLFFLVGKSVECLNLKHIHKASIIGLCLMFFGYVVFKGQTQKDMAFAYSALTYTIGIVHGFFDSKHITYKIFMPIGMFFLFLLGTRGPLVIGLAYLALCFLKNKHSVRRLLVSLIIIAFAFNFIESTGYLQLLTQIDEFLKQYGIESYIIKNALMGSTASVDSRIEYSTYIWELLQNNLFLVHGLCGDRVVLNGSYSHNFFSEFLYAYGGFGGSILIAMGAVGIMFLYKRLTSKNGKDLLIMVLFAFFLKLLFSGSFVSDIWLYFAIGIMSRLYSRPSEA